MKIESDWYLQYARDPDTKIYELASSRSYRKRKPIDSTSSDRIEKPPRTTKDLVENLTIREVAQHLRCHISHVYHLIQSGRLKFQPVGRRKIVPVTALNEYKEKEKQRYHAENSHF